jgi:hypothetical protein
LIDLRHAAHLLGGEVSAGRILCPGPGHSRHDRSLSVRFSNNAPDGFLVQSFANDDWQECKDHVRHFLGLDQFRPGERQPDEIRRPRFERPDEPTDDTKRNKERALAIWSEAIPIRGTPAETYLASRGLSYDGAALRWHPRCPFGRGMRVGCMVALVRNIVTDEPQAIHRTAIGRDGKKLSHLGSNGRLTLAPIRGGAVKLSPDEDVTTALGIGEGIESVLSLPIVADAPRLPVWSLLSAGPLGEFPVLPGIEALWIAVDHDDAGIRACRTTTARWMAADRPVTHAASETPGDDLNDLLREVA